MKNLLLYTPAICLPIRRCIADMLADPVIIQDNNVLAYVLASSAVVALAIVIMLIINRRK